MALIKIVDLIRCRRLRFGQKWRYIQLRIKQQINGKLGTNLKVHEKEKFVPFCYDFLIRNNGFLLNEYRNSFLSTYNLNGLSPCKLHIRKLPSSDLKVFRQVFIQREYKELVEVVLLYSNMREVKFVMDAGANVGYTTIFLKHFFPEATILSIEPEENNFLQLKKNISVNQLSNVKPLRAGLWKCEEQLEVINSFRDKSDWSFQVVKSERSNAINGYSVKKIIELEGWPYIDILKIDIEGAEQYLFESDEIVSDFLPYVKFIALEIHDEFGIRQKINSKLKSFNFKVIDSGELTIGVNMNFQV